MRFEALELPIELIAFIRDTVDDIAKRDRNLEKQIRSAATSVPLNLSEGSRRLGKDQKHQYRIAAGSADEVRTALRVAEAWGYVDELTIAEALGLLDRILRVITGLTR